MQEDQTTNLTLSTTTHATTMTQPIAANENSESKAKTEETGNFVIDLLSNKPVEFLRIDPKTKKQVYLKVESSYPLYKFLNLLDLFNKLSIKFLNNHKVASILNDAINQAYITSSNAIAQKEKNGL